MFFDTTQPSKSRTLPSSVDNLKTNTQSWFSGLPGGQTVSGLQDTSQQYQQQLNDWFNQTSLGQEISGFNNTFNQRMQQSQSSEQARYAEELTRIYDQALGSLFSW